MTENQDFRPSAALFDKMDALLARHRASPAQDIPVLTEEASADAPPEIPVLTQAVADSELMFDPREFHSPPANQPGEPLFLDLPLLDLDQLDEAVPQLPPDAFVAEAVTVIPAGLLHALEMPEIVLAGESPAQVEEIIELGAPDEETAPSLAASPSQAHEPRPLEEAPAATLSDAEIAEITATVEAQIAVEVATEVEQLARQHFTRMMQNFYNETLHKMTEEISRDMQMCLAPRIVELVEDELRRRGAIR